MQSLPSASRFPGWRQGFEEGLERRRLVFSQVVNDRLHHGGADIFESAVAIGASRGSPVVVTFAAAQPLLSFVSGAARSAACAAETLARTSSPAKCLQHLQRDAGDLLNAFVESFDASSSVAGEPGSGPSCSRDGKSRIAAVLPDKVRLERREAIT